MTYLFDFVQIHGIHSGRSKKLVEIMKGVRRTRLDARPNVV
jgi:hypothetical protein